MFFYQLPNGKTITVSTLEELLNLDVQEKLAENSGREINNPFFDTHSDNEGIEVEELISIDLPDINSIEEIEIDEDIED